VPHGIYFSVIFFGSRSTKLRIYFTLLLLTFFTLTASYKGSLTSNLSIEARPKPLNTARELADRSLTVGSSDAQSCTLLEENPDPDFRALSDHCMVYGYDFDRGFKMVDDREIAILESTIFLQYEQRSRFTDK
jgi:hypothetical protein